MLQMHRNITSPPSASTRPPRIRPIVLGTACCVFAAFGYSVVNICLRHLRNGYDPAWILCMKESMAVVVLGPWFVWEAMRGRFHFPTGRPLAALLVVGLLTHLIGNLPLIWAMGVVGLAVTIPVSLGVNLVACAVLGKVWLHEHVTLRSVIALAILIVSVVLLSAGAGRANDSMAATTESASAASGTAWVLLAVAGSCLAGIAFSLLNVTLRKSATAGISLVALAFLVPAMGSVSLFPICLIRQGYSELAATTPSDFWLMVLAGVLNLASFMAIIKGLHLTTIVHANVLSATQVAMAAVAGLLFFGEGAHGVSAALVVGIVLTIVGTILIRPPDA